MDLAVAKQPDMLLDLIDVQRHQLWCDGRAFHFYSWRRKPESHIRLQLAALDKLASNPACVTAHRSVNPFLSDIPLVGFRDSPMLPTLNFDRGQLGLQLCSLEIDSPAAFERELAQTRERLLDMDFQIHTEEKEEFISNIQAVWCERTGVNYLVPFHWHQAFTDPNVLLEMFKRCFYRCHAFPIFAASTHMLLRVWLGVVASAGYPHMPDGIFTRWSPIVVVDEDMPVCLTGVPMLGEPGLGTLRADVLNGYIRDRSGHIVSDCGHIYAVMLRTRRSAADLAKADKWLTELIASCQDSAIPVFLSKKSQGVSKTQKE